MSLAATIVACAQCGLPAPAPPSAEPAFCCDGCRTTYALARGETLPDEAWISLDYPFDDPEFLAELGGGDGPLYQLAFRLEEMHCPSCIRLIEGVAGKLPGVSEVKVQFTARRLDLSWDQAQTPLSTVARKLGGLGYPMAPIVESTTTKQYRADRRAWALRLAVAAFGAVSAGFLGEGLTWGNWSSSDDASWVLLAWMSLIISTPVLVYTGLPFLRGALQGLRHGVLGMDLTIALGAVATYLGSLWSIVRGSGHLYFDSLTMFLFLIVAGRWAEAWAQERAANAADRLLPPPANRARVWRDERWIELPASGIRIGDRVAVGAGDLCPVDGTVISGQAEVDESLLTGESRPVLRTAGDPAYGGALVVDGALEVRADQVGAATTVSRLRQLAEQASGTHSPMNRMAEKASHWLILVILAAAVFTAWLWSAEPDKALTYAVAVLIISCPCALGLATPAALSLAAARAWRLGVLVKDGGAFEKLGRLTHLVFDKTGTVTTGEVTVDQIAPAAGHTAEQLLQAAAPITARSVHPLSRALTIAAPSGADGQVSDWHNVAGHGLTAMVDGRQVRVGRAAWLAEAGIHLPEDLLDQADHAARQGRSLTWVAADGLCLGFVSFRAALRPDAAETIGQLKASGVSVSLLSGDLQTATAAMAAQLQCDDAHGEVLPDGKLATITGMRARNRMVGMVGDGINDGPALAAADVGIAIGQGSGLAIETAPIVLLGHRLGPLADVLHLARKTRRIIRENLVISVAYNVVAIPLAVAGFVTPAVAAVMMPVSSLLVLANAARIAGGR